MTNDTADAPAARDAATAFHDLSDYMAIPRVTALRLAPGGSWLAASVQTLSADRKKYVTSIWRIDARGGQPRRLTRSADGEGGPRFLPDGSLLFTSKRPDPDAKAENGDAVAALWLLPPGGGEARVIWSPAGGVTEVETAAGRRRVVAVSPVLPDDERLRKERKDAGVTAILHETVPARYWDHDLGPTDLRMFALAAAADGAGDDEGGAYAARDLTPEAGRALFEPSFALSPDGTVAATTWWRWRDGVQTHKELVLVDLASGRQTALLTDPDLDFEDPAFAPDGRHLVCVRGTHPTPSEPHDFTLVLVPAGEPGAGAPGTGPEPARDLVPHLDRWPRDPVWDPSGRAVFFTADDAGRHPVFRVDLATSEVTRVTADHGYYSDVSPSPDGAALYALRAAVDAPPAPVRIDLATGQVVPLPCPGAQLGLPGRLTEITATADDGHPVRGWLVLPESASPRARAPLLLWVHGGPMMSWNSWSWRWNPWLMAAKGYAVLLPDPALSTGYGNGFIRRGYHQWGERPFRDVMAATDAAAGREDIDGSRTAMMGGSYGGYMANWIAGHTDRFRAIVSHAGLWALDQMFGTTDVPHLFHPQFGDPLTAPRMYEENSPHLHVAKVTTPMLVIHGNRDFRVPVSEAFRLWWDLIRHQVPAKFLYFPDENHWILTPGNATVWYETVFAFLGEHVLGEPWQRPSLL
ncbi:S9 family peptidase [Trebonia sp.]|uniref:S9 family peptidase n=1 Tax=Trebonia sp. TaxID=2767075 RepID=UPI00260391FA|nr:S9 family peptidase [Trebonia sp.]